MSYPVCVHVLNDTQRSKYHVCQHLLHVQRWEMGFSSSSDASTADWLVMLVAAASSSSASGFFAPTGFSMTVCPWAGVVSIGRAPSTSFLASGTFSS